MRVGHLQPTRPEWFDRNPTPVILSTTGSYTGAQATTVLSSYTVPSGKKAYIDAAMVSVFRLVDAVPNVRVLVNLRYDDGTGTRSIQRIDSSVSTYGAVGDQWLGQAGIMVPGDYLEWQLNITATDGTVSVTGTAKVTEFDA